MGTGSYAALLIGLIGAAMPYGGTAAAAAEVCRSSDRAADALNPPADCEAVALGGEGNAASASTDGSAAKARALAGSLDLYDNPGKDAPLASSGNTALAKATRRGQALARAGVNQRGKAGAAGNSALAEAHGRNVLADASAANGSENAATAFARDCGGEPRQPCAFAAAGNGDRNQASADAEGRGARAQAGALDGERNIASARGVGGGIAFSNAQGGDGNLADADASGKAAFATAQSTGGDSRSLARASGTRSLANALGESGGSASAIATDGGNASATAIGRGFSAMATASGANTTASATHDADSDTGRCSGPGVAIAMTGGKVHCSQGF